MCLQRATYAKKKQKQTNKQNFDILERALYMKTGSICLTYVSSK